MYKQNSREVMNRTPFPFLGKQIRCPYYLMVRISKKYNFLQCWSYLSVVLRLESKTYNKLRFPSDSSLPGPDQTSSEPFDLFRTGTVKKFLYIPQDGC